MRAPPADLHRRMVWLTVFRTATTMLSLGAIALRLLAQPTRELSSTDTLAFGLIGLTFLVTLAHALLLRQGRAGPVAAALQVLGDLVIGSGLVLLTGGPESPFTFTYSLAVVGAALLLGMRGALLTAGATTLFYALLLLLAVGAPTLVPAGWGPGPATERALLLLVSHFLAFFLIAGLSGFLMRNLTAREADLRRLGDLQKQILSSMPSGLLTCDAAGYITFVNRAGAAILERSEGALRGTHVDTVMPGLGTLGAGTARGELSAPTPQGPRVLGVSVSALGEEEGLLAVFQDLTGLRRMEEELRRLDRLATLGALSAQLAHEVRNPLAAMRGSAQLLAQDAAADAPARRLTSILVREADRLEGLVESYLKLARPPPPVKAEASLAELATEMVEMLRADPLAYGMRVALRVAPVTAQVDVGQLRQALLNLLRNALQAAAPRGEVRLVVEGDAHEARLRVWDSAGAIPAEVLPRLFEPFFTTRSSGTGLGLSTAHAIVAAHGGTLQARSSPEQGTEFVIRLPRAVVPTVKVPEAV